MKLLLRYPFITISITNLMIFGLPITSALADTPAKSGLKTSKSSGAKKPKILPWGAFKVSDEESEDEDDRTYNLFKYKMSAPKIDAGNPEDWRSFNPSMCSQKIKLIPSPAALKGIAPEKYATAELALPRDPSKNGAFKVGYNNTMIFAHQGTPLSNGWLAPQAGYAYEIDGTIIYGTTNYTPINYNGEISKYIGLSRVPVEILSESGSKTSLDLSRVVFAINDEMLTRPHTKVYPSLIYLKPGEKANILGHGVVNCPKPDSPQEVTVQTLGGEQSIRVYCLPDNPVIPGKVTP